MKLKNTSASCAHCSVRFPDGHKTKLEELDSTLLMAVLEELGPYSRPHHAVEDAAVVMSCLSCRAVVSRLGGLERLKSYVHSIEMPGFKVMKS